MNEPTVCEALLLWGAVSLPLLILLYMPHPFEAEICELLKESEDGDGE